MGLSSEAQNDFCQQMDVDFSEGEYYFRGEFCFVIITGVEPEKL